MGGGNSREVNLRTYGSFENGCTLDKGFLGSASGKELACQCRSQERCEFARWVRKIPWRRKWQPTPVFLPGKFHKQRSLAGDHPWGHKVSDMTKHASTRDEISVLL